MSHIIDRTGEIRYNNQGLKMWIKSYRGCEDIDIEFEDGYISYNKRYDNFKEGRVSHSSYRRISSKVGETKYNKYGSKMTIIGYNGNRDVLVKFENDYITNTTYQNFKTGEIKSPYDKTVCGIGCLGEGKYKASKDGKCNNNYTHWKSMLVRCYDKKQLERNPTYKGCSVCKEWHNFQVFAKWYEENYYEIENNKIALDKDILVKGNKIYSPETCVFVPDRINSLFVKRDKTKPFKLEKKFYIKEIAEEYKDKIPTKLYEAMIKLWDEENKNNLIEFYKKNNLIKTYIHYIKYLKEKSYSCDSIFLEGCFETGMFVYGVDRNKIINDINNVEL